MIKQKCENRTTKSWDVSIRNSVKQIQRTNKRRKSKGNYINYDELKETLEDAYFSALDEASLEAFGGIYYSEKLAQMVEKKELINLALDLINN